MANALLQDLAAATTLAGSDLFYVKQAGARGVKATGTQLLALVGTAYVPLAGGTMTGPLISSSSLSGSNFYVNPNGNIGFNTPATGFLFWDDSGDVRLYRDAAATLAQRNGTNAQTFKVYGTTDAGLTNYERLAISAQQGVGFTIGAETLGTGADNLDIVLTPAGNGSVLIPGGAYDSPGLGFAAYPGTGIWAGSADYMYVLCNLTSSLFLGATRAELGTSQIFGWSSVGGAGQASADTALSRNAAGVVEVNNGTAGTWRDLKLRNLLAGGGNGSYVQTPSMTVDRLADAATAGAGARAFVTDANATTFLSTVAAGGSNKVPVVSNGTNWLIG